MGIALISGFYAQHQQTSFCVLQAVEASVKISEGQALTTIT